MKRENPLLISAVVLFCTMLLTAVNTPAAGQTINMAGRSVVVAEPNPPTQPQLTPRPLERGRDCAPDEATIHIRIMTDNWPQETTWDIAHHDTGVPICSGGPYDQADTVYDERCCIAYEDCVFFTIYDSYGDGINPPGGYTIWLDGELVYDCMGDGWYGSMERVEYIGEACVLPTGACCLDDHGCFATTYEDLCDALGGMWYQGETCPEFWCPGPIPDFFVEAPYTSPVRTTCGAGDDCVLRPTEEHEYYVSIPSAGLWSFNTCLLAEWDTYIFLGASLCSGDLGENDDACGLQSEIIVYLEPGGYFCTIEGYGCGNYIFDVHEELPCVLDCPEGARIEAEPCGDDTNGGCLMDEPQFEPIACNDTICGTGWFDGSVRDTDWYEFVATDDDQMYFTVEAEFDVLFGLLEQIVPGQPGCDNLTGLLGLYQLMPDCTPASVEFPVTAGGTYYLFVGPQLAGVFTCDSPSIDYVATLTGDACTCGDFDNDGDVDVDDFYVFLDAFGTCAGDNGYEEVCDFDGDECITLIDYQMWMQCYHDANGKLFVAPLGDGSVNRRPGGRRDPIGP